MAPIVLLDACVLFPPSLRDYLVQLGADAVIRARWSEEIHDEWMHNVLARHHGLTRGVLERTRQAMDEAIWDALVAGFQHRIPALELPDPDDRHVLAAAIEAGAEAIVTLNTSDFPQRRLFPHGLACWSPDQLTQELLRREPSGVAGAIRRISARLANPPKAPEQIVDGLARKWLRSSRRGLLGALALPRED